MKHAIYVPFRLVTIVTLLSGCGSKTEIRLLNPQNAKVSCEISTGAAPTGAGATSPSSTIVYTPTLETVVTDQGFSRIAEGKGESFVKCKKLLKGDTNSVEVQILVRDSMVSNGITNQELGEVMAKGVLK